MTTLDIKGDKRITTRQLKQKWVKRTHFQFEDERMADSYSPGNRIRHLGRIGAFGGGVLGLFLGSACVFIPRDGLWLMTGPLVSWMLLGLAGAMVVGGLGALAAGIYNLGIAHDSILQSESAFDTSTFGVRGDSSTRQASLARGIIKQSNLQVVGGLPSSRASTNIERWEHSLLP
jgi:hypothetical protein